MSVNFNFESESKVLGTPRSTTQSGLDSFEIKQPTFGAPLPSVDRIVFLLKKDMSKKKENELTQEEISELKRVKDMTGPSRWEQLRQMAVDSRMREKRMPKEERVRQAMMERVLLSRHKDDSFSAPSPRPLVPVTPSLRQQSAEASPSPSPLITPRNASFSVGTPLAATNTTDDVLLGMPVFNASRDLDPIAASALVSGAGGVQPSALVDALLAKIQQQRSAAALARQSQQQQPMPIVSMSPSPASSVLASYLQPQPSSVLLPAAISQQQQQPPEARALFEKPATPLPQHAEPNQPPPPFVLGTSSVEDSVEQDQAEVEVEHVCEWRARAEELERELAESLDARRELEERNAVLSEDSDRAQAEMTELKEELNAARNEVDVLVRQLTFAEEQAVVSRVRAQQLEEQLSAAGSPNHHQQQHQDQVTDEHDLAQANQRVEDIEQRLLTALRATTAADDQRPAPTADRPANVEVMVRRNQALQSKVRLLSSAIVELNAKCKALSEGLRQLKEGTVNMLAETHDELARTGDAILAANGELTSNLVDRLARQEAEIADAHNALVAMAEGSSPLNHSMHMSNVFGGSLASGMGAGVETQPRRFMKRSPHDRVCAFLRVRPIDPLAKSAVSILDDRTVEVVRLRGGSGDKKSFSVDHIFGPLASQDEVAEALCSHVCPQVLEEGHNMCIMAYGQTASGKTFTLDGGGSGMSWHVLQALFVGVEERRHTHVQRVSMTACELAADSCVRDLVANTTSGSSSTKSARKGSTTDRFPPELMSVEVATYEEAERVLQVVFDRRKSKGAADHNPRATLVVQVSVESTAVHTLQQTSAVLSFVDLAGSDTSSNGDTGSDIVAEMCELKKNLVALGEVVNGLANHRVHVPYRNSKLTQLLQGPLSNEAALFLFHCIHPAIANCTDTLRTLSFSTRSRASAPPPTVSVDLGSSLRDSNSATIHEFLMNSSYPVYGSRRSVAGSVRTGARTRSPSLSISSAHGVEDTSEPSMSGTFGPRTS